MYQCYNPKCKAIVSYEEMSSFKKGDVRCPECNGRILLKMRSDTVRTVKSD